MLLAHRVEKDNNIRTQTLKNHCENVSLLMKYFCYEINIQNLVFVVGYLHDLGKAKKEFQDYLINVDQYRKGTINHSSSGAILIYEKILHEHDLKNKVTGQLLYLAIMSHHSGLTDCLDPHGEDCLIKRLTGKEDDSIQELINTYFTECIGNCFIESLIDKAIREVDFFIERNYEVYTNRQKDLKEILFSLGMLEKHIFSCLLDADRYDTACFYNEIPIAFKQKERPNWGGLLLRLEAYIDTFKMDNEIDKLRCEISNSCKEFGQESQGIYQLYVPTGGGKTLSSLRYALTHALTHTNIERIIYVMPYLTILSQNSRTIKDILEKGNEHIILEHFSNLVQDEIVTEEDVSIKDALIERWDSEIIITSMVHFLESLFSGKGQAVRRMHQLTNAIIIIDEIQTIPDRVVYMFNGAMNYLKNFCNTTIVLCSATQPTLHDVKYPIQLTKPTYIVKDYQEKFFQFKRVQIVDKTKKIKFTVDEVVNLIYEEMTDIDNMLVILNTKKFVIDTYKELIRRNDLLAEDKKYQIVCLTTNMCAKHRHEKLEWIKKNLKSKRIICVSTSLIEAGVDISFKAVIRALTGLDSIAQAAGRCNRHSELDKGYVYLINTEEKGVKYLDKVTKGIEVMEDLMNEYRLYPMKFDNDILSPKSLSIYYRRYYHDCEGVLSYPSKELNGLDMFTCLSSNGYARQAYKDHHKKNSPYLLNQSFQSAGRVFEAIEKDTMSVIAPFGYGKEIIVELLRRNTDFKYVKQLLNQAQPYTLNLYRNKISELHQGIYLIEEYNVYILGEGYYDQDIGLTEFESLVDII